MSEQTDKISIIVPVYNTADYLRQCLDSLVNQTYRNIEIICVNDGSTDKSGEILEEYAKKHEKIHVFHQQNSGVSCARNLGLEKAKGDWIMFVDSDDWLDEDACEEMMNNAKSNEAEITMCSYVKEYENQKIIKHIFEKPMKKTKEEVCEIQRRLFGPLDAETKNPLDLDLPVSPCMQLFRKKVLDGVAFQDIRKLGTFEDGLFQIDAYANCGSFSYIDKPLYHYRKTNTSSITSKYKPKLAYQWENLYSLLEEKIEKYKYPETYSKGLKNRIVLGLVGLTLNESAAKDGVVKKAERLKQIVALPRYRKALNQFDDSYLSFKWKVFFGLLKWKMTFLVAIMLEIIKNLVEREVKSNRADV